MDSGYYAAFTGLVARIQALDVIANNLANINTTGFRGQREFYRSITANLADFPLSPLNQAINDYGVLGGSDVDLRQGNLERTGNPTDLAISGPGFFAVQSRGGIRYTRNGTFHVSPANQIVTQDGQIVLGPRNLPIQVPPGKIEIASDGSVSVAGATVGQIQLVEFSPDTNLVPEGNSNFIAPEGAASPAAHSMVSQSMLESSNLNPIEQTVTMMALQRHSELLEHTLSIFQNDFDKTAELDLARD